MMITKLQSATEFLFTYSWAFIVVFIALALVFYFSGSLINNSQQTQCYFQSVLLCENANLLSNGLLTINVGYTGDYYVNITAISCSPNITKSIPVAVSPAVTVFSTSNATVSVQCYQGTGVFTGSPSTTYTGYVLLNYSNYLGESYTTYAKLVAKVA